MSQPRIFGIRCEGDMELEIEPIVGGKYILLYIKYYAMETSNRIEPTPIRSLIKTENVNITSLISRLSNCGMEAPDVDADSEIWARFVYTIFKLPRIGIVAHSFYIEIGMAVIDNCTLIEYESASPQS